MPALALGVLHDRLNPVLVETLRNLRERGVAVRTFAASDSAAHAVSAPAPDCDLYYLKTTHPAALGLAGALHAAGAPMVNAYEAVTTLVDKARAAAMLGAAGLPTPETWLVSGVDAASALLDAGPIVLKPAGGSRGRGVRVARAAEDVDGVSPAEPHVAQRWHRSDDGLDRKIYCIGDRLFGVLRAWPPADDEAKRGRPFEPDSALRDLARASGRLFGLELHGLDVVISEGRPWIVDVNKCPGFLGVPGGATLLADFLERRARAARGERSA